MFGPVISKISWSLCISVEFATYFGFFIMSSKIGCLPFSMKRRSSSNCGRTYPYFADTSAMATCASTSAKNLLNFCSLGKYARISSNIIWNNCFSIRIAFSSACKIASSFSFNSGEIKRSLFVNV